MSSSKRSLPRLLLTLLIVPVSITLFLLSLQHDEYSLYPLKEGFTLFTYTDAEDPHKRGNSEIVSFSTDSVISLAVTIKGAIDYPYAGFRIKPEGGEPFFDISSYDKVEIVIDSTNATFFILDLATYVDGYSNFTDYMSLRHHTAEVFTSAKAQTLSLKTRSIPTQSWWYELRNLTSKEVGKADYSKCHALSFEINAVNLQEEPLYVSVSSIKFINTKRTEFYASLVLLGLYFVLLFIVDRLFAKRKRPILVNSIAMKNDLDAEIERIEFSIAELYHNADLTVAKVAHVAGMSPEKLSASLFKVHKMQFKQYLNTVRVTEAKRLLKETDRNISEIAMAVGYNYPTTFNRVFKEITGTSPTSFRSVSGS